MHNVRQCLRFTRPRFLRTPSKMCAPVAPTKTSWDARCQMETAVNKQSFSNLWLPCLFGSGVRKVPASTQGGSPSMTISAA